MIAISATENFSSSELADAIWRGSTPQDILILICELDDAVCECEFTEKVISKLAKTLEEDEPDWRPDIWK